MTLFSENVQYILSFGFIFWVTAGSDGAPCFFQPENGHLHGRIQRDLLPDGSNGPRQRIIEMPD